MLRFYQSSKFVEDDKGVASVWMVIWMLALLVMGGVAIDSSNAWRMRAELQATADAAAHAAVIDLPGEDEARATAIGFAARNMAPAAHGVVLAETDVEFGVWNDGFIAASGPIVDSIRVVTRRSAASDNALSTSFLRLIGVDAFDVEAQAVAQRYFPECMKRDGLFARRTVNLQSNNAFYSGICIHGNYNVIVNNNNTWEADLTVSMPDLADMGLPSSDIDVSNPGLQEVLKEEWLDPKIVNLTDEIIAGFLDRTSPYMPVWINPLLEVIEIPKNQFDSNNLQPGRIYHVRCVNNQNLNMRNGANISNVIIITDCRVQTGQGATFENVILGVTASDGSGPNDYALKIAESTRMGADDHCTPGGGVKVFSNGSVNAASGGEFYGVQMVAKKTIIAAAQAQGMEGIQFFAGEDINVTSGNAFGGTCVGGVDAIIVPHFRIVM